MAKRDDTQLRGYQQDLIGETVQALRNHRSVLLQAPTGAGKTPMAVDIATRSCGSSFTGTSLSGRHPWR
jgi:superfamily II DNA or RNA helicase